MAVSEAARPELAGAGSGSYGSQNLLAGEKEKEVGEMALGKMGWAGGGGLPGAGSIPVWGSSWVSGAREGKAGEGDFKEEFG